MGSEWNSASFRLTLNKAWHLSGPVVKWGYPGNPRPLRQQERASTGNLGPPLQGRKKRFLCLFPSAELVSVSLRWD